MSNGGFMSYELACKLSNRVAAIASVTGSMAQSRLNACTPQHPVPIMEIHGTADNTVPYNGNVLFVPVPAVVDYWVRFNGCSPTPTFTAVPNTNTSDGSTAERYVYSGGRNGSVVEHYKIINGGHTWPGAPVNIGVTNRDISASREVWRFLRRYRLSQLGTTLGTATKAAAADITVFPNPAADMVTVRAGSALRPEQISVADALGKSVPVRATRTADGALQVSTKGWRSGVYLLRVESNGQTSIHKLVKP
jgi:polyhydroxybutyrate depolymerase